jgi:hypothetical protein
MDFNAKLVWYPVYVLYFSNIVRNLIRNPIIKLIIEMVSETIKLR